MNFKTIFLISIISIPFLSKAQSTYDRNLYVPHGVIYPTTGNESQPTYSINVGIGVENPEYTLDINGYPEGIVRIGGGGIPYPRMGVLFGSGDAFIGLKPDRFNSLLHITNAKGILINNKVNFGSSPALTSVQGKFNFYGNTWMDSLVIADQADPGPGVYTLPEGFRFGINVKSQFNQFVGIDTHCSSVADPAVMLAVKGKIFSEGMKVKLSGDDCWADFVFEDKYNLRPLSEVKKYIEKNKHLPEIPSAVEITENGLSVEEMLKLQMQKIEELTLYTIQLQEKLEESTKNFENLSKQVNKMKQGK